MKGLYFRLSCLPFSFLFTLFLYSPLYSQVIVTVLDDSNNKPLSEVEIFNDSFNKKYVTNRKGQVEIDTVNVVSFHFNKDGYSSRELLLRILLQSQNVIRLSPLSQILEEIVLIGNNTLREEDKYHQIEVIGSADIAFTNPQTTADALADHGGVFVQKSQMGGGSPIVRGFEANRVLLVIDGVRLNNAIYRNGHLQNAITVDGSIIDQVNVLYGPNSLAFGSDAIGGVVSFKTKNPSFSDSEDVKYALNAHTRYSSANFEKTAHAHFSLGIKNMASLTSISFSDFGDLRSGAHRDDRFPQFGLRPDYVVTSDDGTDMIVNNDDQNQQIGTSYYQYDLLQKLMFRTNKNNFFTVNVHYSSTGDIPRYDNLQERINGELRFSEWYYGPQTRFLSSLQLKNYNSRKFYDRYIVTAAYQYIEEDRISRNFGSEIRSSQNEDVHVRSLTFELEKSFGKNLSEITLLYGIDIQDNDVQSSAFQDNIITLQKSNNELSRYADGDNDFLTYGAFLEAEYKNDKNPIQIKSGLRYSGSAYSIRYQNSAIVEWPEQFLAGVSASNNALTWSLSARYQSENGWYFRALSSSAFRSPNIDDLSKIRVNANEITFPNLDLHPEKSISTEAGLGISGKRLHFNSTIFYTRLYDAIVRRPYATPDGSPTFVSQGESFNVVANQNAQEAYVYGLSVNGEIDFSDHWSIQSAINLTRGREIVDTGGNLPFAHIPPIYGQTNLNFNDHERWQCRLSVRYNGMKGIEDFGGSVDNPELATPIGALGWATLNIYSQYNFNAGLSLAIAFENITDIHYRPFASGVSAPGRNLILTLRTNFSN